MNTTPENLLIGQIAVNKGIISKEQLKASRTYQREIAQETGSTLSLKKILIEAWDLSEKEVAEIEEDLKLGLLSNQISGFELCEKLGEGAMGAVYKATQLSLKRPVALKLLYPSVTEDKEYLERFYREACIAGELDHQSIIQGIDAGEEHGVCYFVMEYVKGETLKEILEKKGRIEENRALKIALQAARAMNHAADHGLIHRDIKPDNIMINQEGVTKICDLGLAKKTNNNEDGSITQTGLALGTPQYMSPEQVRGHELDIRTDIYALGASLYKASTGETPFKADSTQHAMTQHVTEDLVSPKKKSPDLSLQFNRVIEKMMAKDPDHRYQTFFELITDLENIREGKDPVHANVEKAFSRSRRPRRRSFYNRDTSASKTKKQHGQNSSIRKTNKSDSLLNWSFILGFLLFVLSGYLLLAALY